MNFFDRLFRRSTHEHTNVEVPFSTITRWGLYDLSITNPNEIAVLLGLTPVSEEGNKKEIEDSHIRLAALDDLLPYIDIVSELNAKVIVATQMREFADDFEEHVDEEELDSMNEFYKAVSFSALVTAFSVGIELDIFHTHALSLGSVYKEENEQ
jgi:sugar phosphate isomerase/epimerase